MAQRVEACVMQPGVKKPQKEDIGTFFCNPGTPVLRWEVETGDLCQRRGNKREPATTRWKEKTSFF